MSEPFIGQIKMFAGNFAPRGWALCDGQLLAISQNDALFSLFGTIYGGDGRTTFGLPDLRGRLALHQGNGPGLSNRPIGQKSGSETATVSTAQMPSHSHAMVANSTDANQSIARNNVLANSTVQDSYKSDTPVPPSTAAPAPDVGMLLPTSTSPGGQPHANMMPYQCVNYIVALVGVYPSRN